LKNITQNAEKAYVREKAAVVDQEPRENAARAFLAALRDDWKPKVKIVKVRKKPRCNLDTRAAEEHIPEEASKKLAEGSANSASNSEPPEVEGES